MLAGLVAPWPGSAPAGPALPDPIPAVTRHAAPGRRRGRGGAGRRPARGGGTVALLAALVALGTAAAPGEAGHGGAVQLRAVAAGPYTVSVWTQPVPARPGPWQIDVAVMGRGAAPVSDARVRVRAEPLAGGSRPAEGDARRDADPLGVRHRAELALAAAGPWQVTVEVTGPAGAGSVTFPLHVEPGGPGWWPALAAGGALAAGLGWLAIRRRRGPVPVARTPAAGRPR